MLTHLVNSLFKNGKSEKSLQWAEQLKQSMEEFNHLLYDKYFFFYYNALVINYSEVDPEKAIDILENLRENTKIKNNDYYIFFVYLNLAVLRFDQKEYKDASKHFNKISMLNWYKSADDSLQLKITVCELITRYQLQQYDVLIYKLEQTNRGFKAALTSEENKAEKEVLSLLKRLEKAISIKKDKNLLDKINEIQLWMRKEINPETYIINYENWLQDLIN
jgi:tetratricopeptide (TPR) repeat protein